MKKPLENNHADIITLRRPKAPGKIAQTLTGLKDIRYYKAIFLATTRISRKIDESKIRA